MSLDVQYDPDFREYEFRFVTSVARTDLDQFLTELARIERGLGINDTEPRLMATEPKSQHTHCEHVIGRQYVAGGTSVETLQCCWCDYKSCHAASDHGPHRPQREATNSLLVGELIAAFGVAGLSGGGVVGSSPAAASMP
jgi:hypothetical protein